MYKLLLTSEIEEICNLNSRLPLFQGSKAVYMVTKFFTCNRAVDALQSATVYVIYILYNHLDSEFHVCDSFSV